MQEEYIPSNIEKAEKAPPYHPKKITLADYYERRQRELQDKLEEDPTAGPRPRTIHPTKEKQKPITHTIELKQQRKRGGKLVKQRKELAALYALVRDNNADLTWDQSTRIYERIDKLHLDHSKNFHKKKNPDHGKY